MKFYYLKHKVTGSIVVADFDSNEEGSWVNLSLGDEGEQPYFGSKNELTEILEGKMFGSWSYEISSSIRSAIVNMEVEIKEVEL